MRELWTVTPRRGTGEIRGPGGSGGMVKFGVNFFDILSSFVSVFIITIIKTTSEFRSVSVT